MEIGSDSAQRFVVLGAQMVGAVFMAELVDQHPHHVLGDAVLEPVRAEPELVEDQFAASAVGRIGPDDAAWRRTSP